MRTAADPPPPVRVLLVEDDEGDAVLVAELFAEIGEIGDVTHVRSLAEAGPRLASADCVLLDMNLPDAGGLDALTRVLAVENHPAVVVLTGDVDENHGREAVAAGAEDYLIKGRVDGQLLTRAVQYAVERRRVEHLDRQLHEARIHEQENRRLGRGLLPTALLHDRALRVTARYQPGARRMLLGGDFYDAVETDDGTLNMIIGDVSGHGPDEAAIGVSLRIAWRTMILAGMPAAHVLPVLDRVLVTERHDPTLFTTVAMLSVAPDRRTLDLYLAGHPPPVLVAGPDPDPGHGHGHGPGHGHGDVRDGVPRLLPDHLLGVPLGVRLGTEWPAAPVTLPAHWSLLLYTDGLIEARDADGEVLWTDGLLELLAGQLAAAGPTWHTDHDRSLDALLAAVDRRTPQRGDDRALAVLTHTPALEKRIVRDHEPTPESCGTVRREVRAFLRDQGVDEDTVGDAVLIASELASNAVDHARTPYRLSVALSEKGVRLEVSDGSAAPPQLRAHDVHAARGRGLQMIDTVAASWTFHHHEGGKTVVADLDVTPG